MILQNSVSSQSKKVTEQKISLFNILTCLLCLSKAKMAHICPNCSKFYCQQCIKTHLNKNPPSSHICPNCQHPLPPSNLVNCNKLSQDLSTALETLITLQTPNEQSCPHHQSLPQTYYCHPCHKSICSDCIVLGTQHTGHQIVKLKQIKVQFNEKVLGIMAKIRKRCKEIQTRQRAKDSGELTKEKIQRVNLYMAKIKAYYEGIVSEIVAKFQERLEGNKLMQISTQKIYDQFAEQAKNMSKIHLIRKKKDQIQGVLLNSMDQIGRGYIEKQQIQRTIYNSQVSNLITSRFVHKTFILYNYTQFRDKKEVIYSDAFFDGPLEWRLKIYPNGLQKKPSKQRQPIAPSRLAKTLSTTSLTTQNSSQQYISIYIELVNGVRDNGRYQFNIQIVNQMDQTKVISQIYEADFQIGKCWGYDEFANIGSLYQKGYVHPEEDSIKISVSVGPPSYYYSTLDQQAIIQKKQQQIWRNVLKLQQLKASLLCNPKNPLAATQLAPQQNPQHGLNESQISDIKTPRCRIPPQPHPEPQQPHLALKSAQLQLQFQLDFEHYIVELPRQTTRKEEPALRHSNNNSATNMAANGEQFDHQAAELRKMYRRISNLRQRTSLLMF